jgi:uncharacterized glyoxalase superfamily protein PhnB
MTIGVQHLTPLLQVFDMPTSQAHQDASIYLAAPNVDAVYEHLRAQGVSAGEPKVAPYGMKQLYVSDPDGYLLCFQWRADEHADSEEGAASS